MKSRIGLERKKDGCLTKSKKSFNDKILQNEQKVELDWREEKNGCLMISIRVNDKIMQNE